MNNLPNEIIEIIINFLRSIDDIISMSEVNKSLLSIISSCHIYTTVHIVNERCANRYINRCPMLKSIKISQFYGGNIKTIVNIQSLQSLDLSFYKSITNDNVALILTKCTSIKTLYLNYLWHIKDNTMKLLTQLIHLQTLNLADCYEITDETAMSLALCTDLRSLDLSRCDNITDATTQALMICSKLESLNFFGCYQITDQTINYIVSHPNFKRICLRGCDISDKARDYLEQFSRIKNI